MPGTTVTEGGRKALRLSLNEAALAGKFHKLCQPPRFRARDVAAEFCYPVITTPFVVVSRCWSLSRFHDQTLIEHSLNGPIQRASANLELPARSRSNVLNDRVAVKIVLGERQKNMKSNWRQRKQ